MLYASALSGVGGRGTGLVGELLKLEGVEIRAIGDVVKTDDGCGPVVEKDRRYVCIWSRGRLAAKLELATFGSGGPVRIFVSGEHGTLFAGEFGHPVLEHDGKVVQRLFPVPNRHRPTPGRLTNRHVNQLQG